MADPPTPRDQARREALRVTEPPTKLDGLVRGAPLLLGVDVVERGGLTDEEQHPTSEILVADRDESLVEQAEHDGPKAAGNNPRSGRADRDVGQNGRLGCASGDLGRTQVLLARLLRLA